MKRHLLLTAILLCAVHIFSQTNSSVWKESYYDKYDYTNYTSFAAFNQSIESGYDAALMEAAIFYATNRQRDLHGLPQLKFDKNLRICAHNHSVDMVKQDFFSHESPVAGKRTMSDRFKQVGYTNCACAENIALFPIEDSYAKTAELMVADLWMNSNGHRANILNGVYNYLGCGAAFYMDGSFVYVKATKNFLKR